MSRLSARRRGLTAGALCTALGLSLLAAAPAQAATPATITGTVSAATLDWGVKASFRSYVTGPIAKGSILASQGANQQSGNGTILWGKGAGSLKGGVGTLSFAGRVQFLGHNGQLNMTLANPKVVLNSGTTGELRLSADVPAAPSMGIPAYRNSNAAVAKLNFSGAAVASGKLELKNVSAVLTEEGRKAFAAFYPAGTALDPLGLAGTFTDNRAKTTADLKVPTSQYNTPATLQATIIGAAANELVVFKRGAAQLGVARTNAKGLAVLKVRLGAVGASTVTASYAGSSSRGSAAATARAQVIKRTTSSKVTLPGFAKKTAPVATLNVPRLADGSYASGKVRLSWTATDRKPLTQTVSLSPAHRGVLKIKAPFASSGTVTVKASYLGDATTAASSSATLRATAR